MSYRFLIFFLLSASLWACDNEMSTLGKNSGLSLADIARSGDLSSINRVDEDNDVDKLSGAIPSRICGKEGYVYLCREYIFPYCASCHDESGAVERNRIVVNDLDKSMAAALQYSKEEWAQETTENAYCVHCNLDPTGETYQALMRWLDNVNCP